MQAAVLIVLFAALVEHVYCSIAQNARGSIWALAASEEELHTERERLKRELGKINLQLAAAEKKVPTTTEEDVDTTTAVEELESTSVVITDVSDEASAAATKAEAISLPTSSAEVVAIPKAPTSLKMVITSSTTAEASTKTAKTTSTTVTNTTKANMTEMIVVDAAVVKVVGELDYNHDGRVTMKEFLEVVKIRETPTTTLSTSGGCFKNESTWVPLDMTDTVVTTEADAHACQRRCAQVIGCTHFSFGKVLQDCHLQDAYAIQQTNDPVYTSGPFSCWHAIRNQHAYVDVGNKTYLPKQLACLEMGVLYSPLMGVPHSFASREGDEGPPGQAAIKQCQLHCLATTGCEHFTVHFPGGTCRLSGANAYALKSWQNAVSGPREGCASPDFVWKSESFVGQVRAGVHLSSVQSLVMMVGGALALSVLGVVWSFNKRSRDLLRGRAIRSSSLMMDGNREDESKLMVAA